MDISERLPEAFRGRTGWILAAVAVLIVIGIVISRRSSDVDSAPAQSSALTVTTTTLRNVEVARGIAANGSIFPWQEIVIGPEVGGYRVAAVHVDVGDKVKRGQEVVRLRDELLAVEFASKRANVQQAEATRENAAAAFRRAKSLSTSGVLSQSDLDQLRSEELAADARVQVAKADLEAAELRLKYTRVTAPDDGVISSRAVAVGQIAQAGSEMLRMVRKSRVEWRAEIPESRLRDIKVGQTVRLTTADGAQLDGRVRAVSPTIEASTRSGLVYVDLDSSQARAGMFARGEILLERGEAQMLPMSSIVVQDGYNYVFVVGANDTVERRHVETGIIKDRLIEIAKGIGQGERVVEKGAAFLHDKDRVNIVEDATE